MKNQIIKEQFNKQANNYSNWSIAKNEEYFNGYFSFCGIQPIDNLLDVACGPGDFSIFVAKRIKEVCGVDISDKEIEIANRTINELELSNIRFDCNDVEKLPYINNLHSIVVCRYAFHHFTKPYQVFKEMVRCCKKGGKLSIQDISAYENDYVNGFFEEFEKLVDISHNRLLKKIDFEKLYSDNNISNISKLEVTVELSVSEYLDHAIQDAESKMEIDKLLKKGFEDSRLNEFLFLKNGKQYFKRHVYLIVGRK